MPINISFPVIALVVANVIPLVGVLLGGWDLFSIMTLYGLENLVLGVWNWVKMAVVGWAGGFLSVIC